MTHDLDATLEQSHPNMGDGTVGRVAGKRPVTSRFLRSTLWPSILQQTGAQGSRPA